MSRASLAWDQVSWVAAWCDAPLARASELAGWVRLFLEGVVDPQFDAEMYEGLGNSWPGPGPKTLVWPWGGVRTMEYGQSAASRDLVLQQLGEGRLEYLSVAGIVPPDLTVCLCDTYSTVHIYAHLEGRVWEQVVGSLLDAVGPWWVECTRGGRGSLPWFREPSGPPSGGGFALCPVRIRDRVSPVLGEDPAVFVTPAGCEYLVASMPESRAIGTPPDPGWARLAERLAEEFPAGSRRGVPRERDLPVEVLDYGVEEPEKGFTLVLAQEPRPEHLWSLGPLLHGWSRLMGGVGALVEGPIAEVGPDSTHVIEWQAKVALDSEALNTLLSLLRRWILVADVDVDRLIIGTRYTP